MLSNLKTLLDSIKSELSFSKRRTVLRRASYSGSESESTRKNSLYQSESQNPISISHWDSLEELQEVGRGAFGVVYRAWDPVLRRHVALKLFRSDEGQIEEARKLAQVNSPNIVKIFRFETHEGYPGFTMEFVEGMTLAEEIEQAAPLSCKDAAGIGIDLCKAVSAVHSAGLLHRDIKAQNVMREAIGRIVLMDFGLGENVNNPGSGDSFGGTLPYMAPELFVGARASVSTDVYALGVLIYFLVSGEYPVSADGVPGFRKAHAAGSKVPLRENHRSINGGFAKIVERAMAADSRRRFASAEELERALGRWQRTRSRKRVSIIAAAVAAVIAAAVYVSRAPAIPELRLMRITTNDGVSLEPSISADGQLVAYESDAAGGGDFDIWIKRTDENRAHQVTYTPAHETEPTLSPDGKLIAYHSNHSGGGIYVRNVSGGLERFLASFGHNPKFSPDGTEIVFWTGNDAQFGGQAGKIYLVSAGGGGTPRQLVPEFKDARLPVWSSDSNEILFQGCGPECRDPERESDWWTVSATGTDPVKTGALQDVLAQGLSLYLGPVSWRHDSIVFSARMEHGTNLWQIPISKPFWSFHRKAVPLMSSTEEVLDPAMSRNGAIAFSGARSGIDLWKAPILKQGFSQPERLNRDLEIDSMPSISADGQRIMYFRRIGNSRKMIVRAIEGPEMVAVDVPQPTRGVIAASGNLIAYSLPGKKGHQVYIRRAPSWAPEMIAEDGGEVIDVFDEDRRLLIVTNAGITSLDIASGNQALMLKNSESTIDQAQVSPDGKWIVLLSIQDANHSQLYIAPMGSTPITELQWVPITTKASWRDKPRWTRDGRSIVFISKEDDFLCIWKQDLGVDMHPKGMLWSVHMHKAQTSLMYLSRIAFNLSVAKDMILFNAGDVTSSVWIAH